LSLIFDVATLLLKLSCLHEFPDTGDHHEECPEHHADGQNYFESLSFHFFAIFFLCNKSNHRHKRWSMMSHKHFCEKISSSFFLLLFLFFSEIFHFLSSELGKDLRNGLWSQTCCRLIEFAPGRRKIVRKEWKMLGRKISIFNSWI